MMFEKEIIKPFLDAINSYEANNAFCINEEFYTYKELAESISKIRAVLQKERISNNIIGLVVNDDLETYASIFGIWFEGCAYVPLHPQQPIERSMEIIYQAEISLVLNSNPKLVFSTINTINTKDLVFEELNLQINAIPDDNLAYILFTSGSTGIPKGVQISRLNLGAFMKSFWETGIQITKDDRCLQCFDLTFDVSVQSFLVPLTRGACTYTIPHDQIKYSYLYGLLEDHLLTFGAMAPSLIRYLRPYFSEINAPNMRYNILTAEASTVDLIKEWADCIPNAEIIDFYGPTEATIYCTHYTYNRTGNNKQLNGMLSIGKIMPGLAAIIIDEEGNKLGANKKGELCISGDQVTAGYWKNPEKNEMSFFVTEINGKLMRFYKTGDSCYFDEEGDIMLAGRLDNQVKIQGYRIELGEIEYHAREFLKGQNAVATTFNNKMGNSEIALFIEGNLNDKTTLIEFLNSKMPYYMIPTKILAESVFPINTSGKVDRIQLKNKLID
jgi:D-alanine--poly(phosphoribitol) ligase subunit 1